jgi:hypothetical protein
MSSEIINPPLRKIIPLPINKPPRQFYFPHEPGSRVLWLEF